MKSSDRFSERSMIMLEGSRIILYTHSQPNLVLGDWGRGFYVLNRLIDYAKPQMVTSCSYQIIVIMPTTLVISIRDRLVSPI